MLKGCGDAVLLLQLMNGHDCVFVTENTGKNSSWDMFLMTHCKDLIIANSSFSWWGAFLNKNVNRVFVPYPWLNRDCELDVYDDSWVLVKLKSSSTQSSVQTYPH